MKRSIMASIEFSRRYIAICVLEVLKGNIIEIHNASDSVKNSRQFLKENIAKIENKINGKLQKLSIVIDPSHQFNANINVVKESVMLVNRIVSIQDIKNLIAKADVKYKTKNDDIIFVHPLQYEIEDVLSKKYFNAPLGKNGNSLSALLSITKISKEIVDYVTQTVNEVNINIDRILLKPQVMSQNNVSANALLKGSVNIHIDQDYTYLTINKYGATVSMKILENFGHNNLVKGISQFIGFDESEVKKAISIFTSQQKTIGNINSETNEKVKKIIIKFMDKLVAKAKVHITEKNVTHLPIIISGQVNFVDDFCKIAKLHFNGPVTKYEPMTYVEFNYKNRPTNGLSNLNATFSKVIGENILSIIETNPNKFSSLSYNIKKEGILTKMLKKIGVYYERKS